jgi:hypothetical protein
MQNVKCCYANKPVVAGIWYTYFVPWKTTQRFAVPKQGNNMSKTTSLGFAPSPSLFSRLMATIDRLLMASAAISIRNGDLPYFGL